MLSLHLPAKGTRAAPGALDIDIRLALALDHFRWVRWLDGESPDLPREAAGRFLARADDPLAHLQEPAPLSMPLAPQPYRNLPRYSLDERLALDACGRAGLFADEGLTLRKEPGGLWSLRLPGEGDLRRGAPLAELLARAALAWHGADPRKAFP